MRYSPLIVIVVMLGLLLLLTSRSRRQQREVGALQAGLQAGQAVMVGAGMYATIVEVGADGVLLEIAPGVRTRWDRRAVVKVLPSGTPDSEHGTGTEDDRS